MTIEPENAAIGVKNLLYTYEAVLRFAALVFLSEFLQGPRQIPELAKVTRRLGMPHLNDWFTALCAFAKRLHPAGAGVAHSPFDQGGPFHPGLITAVRALVDLRYGEVPLHEALLSFRNQFDGHSATWSEAECRRRLDEYLQVLETVLDTFRVLADIHPLRRVDGSLVRLIGAEERFAIQAGEEPGPDDHFEESSVVLEGPGGARMPMYPIFIGPTDLPTGLDEPLLVYNGNGRSTVAYLGVRTSLSCRETLARYRSLLEAKAITPGFSKGDLRPWQVAEWARESTRDTVASLRNAKYFPSFYQERLARSQCGPAAGTARLTGVDDALRSWLERGSESALIVASGAGLGKTSLLCHIASELLGPEEAQPSGLSADVVLLLLGGTVRGGGQGRLFSRIREGLGIVADPAQGGVAGLTELLDVWQRVGSASDDEHDQRRLILLVDAVNEAEDPKALLEEISSLAATAATFNLRAGRVMVRFVVSLRTERLETLEGRWAQSHDTPLLAHPENFAHFTDAQGRSRPFLELRRFLPDEVAAAFSRAASTLERACPAAWKDLPPRTRDLLEHPLMLLLFHGAFAGQARPPAMTTEPALWDAWLDRTFEPRRGAAHLENVALDLADACLVAGEDDPPEETVAAWRRRWQAGLGNDPVLIAAALDHLERLAEAGLVRWQNQGYVWASDSLAEQLMARALLRRDRDAGEASLRSWLMLPRTSRLDGALVLVGLRLWREGRPEAVAPLLDAGEVLRGEGLMGGVLAHLAPIGPSTEVIDEVRRFENSLAAVVAAVLHRESAVHIETLKNALGLIAGLKLADRIGTSGSLRTVLGAAVRLAERLVEMEPENTHYLGGLSQLFADLGDLDIHLDLSKAREWYAQAMRIRRRSAELEPDNPMILEELADSLDRMGHLEMRSNDLKAWKCFGKALEIRDRLVHLDPGNTRHLARLVISLTNIGGVSECSDPTRARWWYLEGMKIIEGLLQFAPDNASYLEYRVILSDRVGALCERTNLVEAGDWYRKALEAAERLAQLEPDSTSALLRLSQGHQRIGSLDAHSDPDRAREEYRNAVVPVERLLQSEPENTEYLQLLCLLFVQAGDLDARSDRAKGEDWYRKAFEIAEQLVKLDPQDADHQIQLAVSLTRMGDLEVLANPEKARDSYRKVIGILEHLLTREPDNAQARRDLPSSHLKMAEACRLLGDSAGERTQSELGLGTARKALERTPDDSFVQYNMACALARNGLEREALEALARSIDLGIGGAVDAADDPDLTSLQGLPEFNRLLERLSGRQSLV